MTEQNNSRLRRLLPVLGILTILMMSGVGSAAAMNAPQQNSAINYSEGPNPYVHEDQLTINKHSMGSMDVLQYYGDNGNVKSLPATLNQSRHESFAVRYDRINASAYGVFPRNSNASAIDASEWASNSPMTVSQTNGATASGVDSIQFESSGASSTTTATATYDNFSALGDAQKRVIYVTYNVDSASAGSDIVLRVNAKSGAHKDVSLANTTGDGYVKQVKLNSVTTQGTGSFDYIENLSVRVSGADATGTITGLDAEKKTKTVLGKHWNATSEQSEEFYNVSDGGYQDLTSLSTMGDAFSSAELHKLHVFDVRYEASQLDASDVNVTWSDASSYPNYAKLLDDYNRIRVPSAIALDHQGLSLMANQRYVSDRYLTVQYASNTGSADWGNISSWNSLSGKYTGMGDKHVLVSAVQAGSNIVWHGKIKLTQDQVSAAQDIPQNTGGGGSSGPVSSGSGNILMEIVGGLGAFVSGLWLWLKRTATGA